MQAATSAAGAPVRAGGRRARPGFQVSEAKLPERAADSPLVILGMPLGLELAAAWVEMLSLG